MNNLIKLLLAFVLIAIHYNSQAQSRTCICDKALSENFVKEEYTSISYADYKKSLKIIFSKSYEYWHDEKWIDDKDMQSGGSYAEIYSGFMNLNDDQEHQNSQYQKDSTNFQLNDDISLSTYNFISQKTASKTAYNAWLTCIKTHCQDIGLIPEMSVLNGNEVQVTLHFYQKSEKIKTKISLTPSSNLTPKRNNKLRDGITISAGEEPAGTFFIKDITKESQIIISAPGYDVEKLFIPATISVSKHPTQIPKIEITNGTINQNADIKANWGYNPDDANSGYHHAPQPVPYANEKGEGEGPYTQGASSTTKCIPTLDYDGNSHYKWTLNLTNTFHANSGPAGQGGSSYAAPYYKTTIKLPQLLATQSSWNVNITGSSWVTNSQDPDMLGKDVRIDFTSNGINKSFAFKTKSQRSPENFKIDSLAQGEYTMTLQVSKIGLEAKFQQPNDDKIANIETQLSVEILSNKASTTNVNPSPKPNIKPHTGNFIYYVIGGIVIALIAFFFLFNRKRNGR